MTQPEFLAWRDYYRQWPFDDYHRHHRPAALVAQSMGGGGEDALQRRLEWLQPPPDDGLTNADRDIFRAAARHR